PIRWAFDGSTKRLLEANRPCQGDYTEGETGAVESAGGHDRSCQGCNIRGLEMATGKDRIPSGRACVIAQLPVNAGFAASRRKKNRLPCPVLPSFFRCGRQKPWGATRS